MVLLGEGFSAFLGVAVAFLCVATILCKAAALSVGILASLGREVAFLGVGPLLLDVAGFGCEFTVFCAFSFLLTGEGRRLLGVNAA